MQSYVDITTNRWERNIDTKEYFRLRIIGRESSTNCDVTVSTNFRIISNDHILHHYVVVKIDFLHKCYSNRSILISKAASVQI